MIILISSYKHKIMKKEYVYILGNKDTKEKINTNNFSMDFYKVNPEFKSVK